MLQGADGRHALKEAQSQKQLGQRCDCSKTKQTFGKQTVQKRETRFRLPDIWCEREVINLPVNLSIKKYI